MHASQDNNNKSPWGKTANNGRGGRMHCRVVNDSYGSMIDNHRGGDFVPFWAIRNPQSPKGGMTKFLEMASSHWVVWLLDWDCEDRRAGLRRMRAAKESQQRDLCVCVVIR